MDSENSPIGGEFLLFFVDKIIIILDQRIFTSSPVIQISSLTRRFGETNAVDQLTLDVRAGEIFGFLGHNGAGKTTTVRLFNGVLEASCGEARVLGLDPHTHGPALRARTGVLTETPSLDERLTARDNLSIYADLYNIPKEKVPGRVDFLLAEFELADRGDEKVGAYSKGMKQRLALARALLHQPELLFLDEPTSGLDPVAARHVKTWWRIWRGTKAVRFFFVPITLWKRKSYVTAWRSWNRDSSWLWEPRLN